VQRWIAAEEGRAVQSRRPNAPRLASVGRRAALERVRDGTPVSYSFAGDIDEGEPDVLLEAGQIEPGDADGDREGGPASQMETR